MFAVGLHRHPNRDIGELPVQRRWDVIETVTSVDFGPHFRRDPADTVLTSTPEATIGRTHRFTVGPEVLHLADGRSLRVPPHTPGANACIELLRPADKLAVTGLPAPDGLRDEEVRRFGARNPTCVVVAALGRQGQVTRFSVLDTSIPSVAARGLAGAGPILARRGNRYLTQSGYAFPLAAHVRGDCTPDRGTRGTMNSAYVDARNGTIVEVDCLGVA